MFIFHYATRLITILKIVSEHSRYAGNWRCVAYDVYVTIRPLATIRSLAFRLESMDLFRLNRL